MNRINKTNILCLLLAGVVLTILLTAITGHAQQQQQNVSSTVSTVPARVLSADGRVETVRVRQTRPRVVGESLPVADKPTRNWRIGFPNGLLLIERTGTNPSIGARVVWRGWSGSVF